MGNPRCRPHKPIQMVSEGNSQGAVPLFSRPSLSGTEYRLFKPFVPGWIPAGRVTLPAFGVSIGR